MSRARAIAAFGCGLLFAIGLGVAGMTRPSKVLGFLDFAGDWDPSLLFVMGAAVAVTFVLYRVVLRRARPLFDVTFHMPTQRRVDARLLMGAAIFGVGWGLVGYCPGPAIIAVASGALAPLTFVAAMAAGMILFELVDRRGA